MCVNDEISACLRTTKIDTNTLAVVNGNISSMYADFIVYNCDNIRFSYVVSGVVINSDGTHLDIIGSIESYVTGIVALVWCIVVIAIMVNIFTFKNGWYHFYWLYVLLGCIACISMLYRSFNYYYMNINGTNFFPVINYVLDFIQASSFYFAVLLLSKGWGIVRYTMTKTEIYTLTCISN